MEAVRGWRLLKVWKGTEGDLQRKLSGILERKFVGEVRMVGHSAITTLG
jgi:hypothetical protein